MVSIDSNRIDSHAGKKHDVKDDDKKTTSEPQHTTSNHVSHNKASTGDDDIKVEDERRLVDGLAAVIKTVKSLGTNGPYIFAMLYGTIDAILLNGFMAFGAKYFQQQFGLTSSIAGIIYGS